MVSGWAHSIVPHVVPMVVGDVIRPGSVTLSLSPAAWAAVPPGPLTPEHRPPPCPGWEQRVGTEGVDCSLCHGGSSLALRVGWCIFSGWRVRGRPSAVHLVASMAPALPGSPPPQPRTWDQAPGDRAQKTRLRKDVERVPAVGGSSTEPCGLRRTMAVLLRVSPPLVIAEEAGGHGRGAQEPKQLLDITMRHTPFLVETERRAEAGQAGARAGGWRGPLGAGAGEARAPSCHV